MPGIRPDEHYFSDYTRPYGKQLHACLHLAPVGPCRDQVVIAGRRCCPLCTNTMRLDSSVKPARHSSTKGELIVGLASGGQSRWSSGAGPGPGTRQPRDDSTNSSHGGGARNNLPGDPPLEWPTVCESGSVRQLGSCLPARTTGEAAFARR